MADVVVCVPQDFEHESAPGLTGYRAWIAEGDAPGTPWSGQEWWWPCGRNPPQIAPGERVYVVCQGRLRGYAPLLRVDVGSHPRTGKQTHFLVRGGGAVSTTIPGRVAGFRGWRYRWWGPEAEVAC